MKKIIFIFLSVILSATIFTSCNQIIEPSKNFYHYSVSMSITTGSSTSSGQIGSVVSDIDIQLGPKLNKLFELTEEEAYLEWDSFISSLQRKPNIKFVGNDYYKVSFVECIMNDDGTTKDGKVIGEHCWDATTHPAQ